MATQYDHISSELQTFITSQNMFFVGTAMQEGRVNISPKGLDSFHIIHKNKVVWLNLTGSGNETAAHLLESNRITIMFCAFQGKPLILRLYGQAKVLHERDQEFETYNKLFPNYLGTRQIVVVEVDLVQTSCGYGVPLMDFKAERDILKIWAEKKGKEGVRAYWKEKNQSSLDGFPTKVIDTDPG